MIDAFAEIFKKEFISSDSIKWEKIKETKSNKSNDIDKIIWKSYKEDESYFQNKNENNSDKLNKSRGKKIYQFKKKSLKNFSEVEPFLPLNNFLDYGNFQTTVRWKSSLDGGKSGGTGQQNPSFLYEHGLSDSLLFSLYISWADDNLYNLINGREGYYYWKNYAISFKKKLLDEKKYNFDMSIVSTLEYWKQVNGSKNKKSIFNQKDNLNGEDKFDNLVGALSFPISKKFNENFTFFIVPGITFLPEKLGAKGVGKNAYGNNFYIGSGLVFDMAKDLNAIISYTTPLGPGNNYFDRNLNYDRKSIYSFGLAWEVNPRIIIESKITNSYGASPSTGLLTIPSDNLPLYSANIIYKPFEEDTVITSLNNRDKLIGHGGITVNNALIPKAGTSQIYFNNDNKGNLFGFYGYSLSNIFQLELLNIGSFNDLSFSGNKNLNLYSTYLGEDNLNFRLGGKLVIFSPQKDDLYWSALRASFGRNNDTNQGYLFSELINTYRVNNWLVFNFAPKYFFSGIESFGGIGFSGYIYLLENLMFIPEINTSIKNDSDFNSTFALRYSFSPEKSLDLYFSNAAGFQDIGQLLKNEENRIGIKLNFLF